MELIILAAGTGSRLWPLTRHVPKSLLDLGDGRCLLERQIENAMACDKIEKVSIVTGYRAAQVEARVAQETSRVPVETTFNPFYKLTNNLVSVWFALQKLRDKDFVISNGDNLYRQTVLPAVTSVPEGIWITIDRKDSYDEDDMKVTLHEDKTVSLISKDIPSEEVHAESVGLAVVRGERFRKLFIRETERLIRDEAMLGSFWLEILNSLARNGTLVRTVEIPRESWTEVDFHPDVNRLRQSIVDRLGWIE